MECPSWESFWNTTPLWHPLRRRRTNIHPSGWQASVMACCLALIRPSPAALNTGDVRLLLSHSQQLLNSQTQAYANLLCWRPSNLFLLLSSFNRLRGKKTRKEKHNGNTLEAAFFTVSFDLKNTVNISVFLRQHLISLSFQFHFLVVAFSSLLVTFGLSVLGHSLSLPNLSVGLKF